MSYRNIYNVIKSHYDTLREAKSNDLARRLAKARQNAQFVKVESAYNEASLAYAKAKATKKDVEACEKAYNEAKTQYMSYICDNNIDLSMHYDCPVCKDSGFDKDGKMCACAKRLFNDLLQKQNFAKKLPSFSFDDNNIKNIDCSQQKALTTLYDKMYEFCQKFTDSKIKFILLTGASGIGKTYLSIAMANELYKKNFSVNFLTAFEFNNLMLKYHTTPIATRSQYMDSVLNCDFLIIDDLGSEPILKSVTKEYLYNVVETRVNDGKRTMITTNLSIEELMLRYGEKTVSRMSNKSYSIVKELIGDNLRIL